MCCLLGSSDSHPLCVFFLSVIMSLLFTIVSHAYQYGDFSFRIFLELFAHWPLSLFCSFTSTAQILHHHIASVEKLSLTTTGCPLVIQCRNFRVVHFVVQRERDCHDIYSSLLRLLRPGRFQCVCFCVSICGFFFSFYTVLLLSCV